jgi:hypothetical protein
VTESTPLPDVQEQEEILAQKGISNFSNQVMFTLPGWRPGTGRILASE